jgi:transketolase
LSRQNLPNLEASSISKAAKGGYVVHEVVNEDLTIVSAGSEVSIAIEAAAKLNAQGIKTRVVSLPCWLVFDQQPEEYRMSVLRSGAPILSLEALSTAGWAKYSHEVCSAFHFYDYVLMSCSNMVFPDSEPLLLTKRCTKSLVSPVQVRRFFAPFLFLSLITDLCSI